MNIELVTFSTEEQTVGGFQARRATHALPAKFLQICQQCKAKEEVCKEELQRGIRKAE